MSLILSRRRFGQLALGAGAAAMLPGRALAANPTGVPLHGLSVFGELKYGPDYTAFDYASPEAPVGGTFRMSVPNWLFNQSPLTFDTLNTFVLKGNAPPRMEMCYDALMTSALDEPDSIYCALAQSVTLSADLNTFTFKLRPEARFSDGSPVTAADVAFSYLTLRDHGHPDLALDLRELIDAVAEDEATVRLMFSGRQSLQTALGVLSSYPVLPKAFFDGRDFETADMTVIPGSGGYLVGAFEPGRFMEYERRDDYWARDLPFARGLGHFQTIRIEFFRDRQIAFEAFKKGALSWREEFTAKNWATEYDFPAMVDGRVKRRTFPGERRPKFQCWALNQRRERFADRRVRQAINLLFDFEWTNANMFYGLYLHSDSCFEGSDFKAMGEPSPEELALLEPLRGAVPEEVFGPAWTQPESDGTGNDRRRLKAALDLFAAAGWKSEGGGLKNAAGERFALEFLIDDQGFERVYSKFIDTARRLGLDARFRLVDAAQYQDRKNRFDYDMIGGAWSLAATPTRDSLTTFFGSETRNREGSSNLPGMGDPAVDALIGNAATAKSREELVTAMRALDRLLRVRLDWIPNIHSAEHRVAYWDEFSFREDKPDYGWPVESLWWSKTAGQN
ncbi:extracellular solute-binding protein [Consotaella salsifontis]|uniref:Microcin C transport system substrate-binding protein n=1 Tax=Consotaella salsifontis TaxID=1365950 RepID=A0A1T4S023_9HYPH|nr:extracellular solute-binding protein [Consotaella salsifontis]SKA21565.1 microcin C transport system substrate-binding protein [Consotaella salsifontis]